MRIPVLLLLAVCVLPAEEVVRAIRLDQLVVSEGKLPAAEGSWEPTIAGGEALTGGDGDKRVLLLRLPALAEVKGVLAVWPAEPDQPAQRVAFTIPVAVLQAAPDARADFDRAQVTYCEWWLGAIDQGPERIMPEGVDRGGRAWWTMQRSRAGGTGDIFARRRRGNDLDQTIDLFSGTTALSENLQFDRTLRVRGEGEPSVAIASLPQLTVREVPWDRMPGAGAKVELDTLAARIPDDQHAVLFPSFDALTAGLAQVDALLAGPLQAAAGRSDDAGTAQRCQRQLGLELSELSKRFGASVVDQVAITGSDPFVRAGSDVAVLLRAKQPALLAAYLNAKVEGLVKAGATAVQGKAGALPWRGAVTADRNVSCHLLLDGEVAVVANSPVQLEAYAAVRAGTRPALDKAPEFAFFRRRYVLGTADELALAVVPDAALRRWCSARWRIGDSRRTRAAGVLAALQAEWIAAGAKPGWKPADPPADLGELSLGADGLRSSLYGSLAFLTPIAELAIDQVTAGEAEAYRRFHDAYQRAWRDFLDPIGLQLSRRAGGGLGIDLSILPLIVGSEYREMLEFAGKATLTAGAGDQHAALLQMAMAIDRENEHFLDLDRDFGRTLGGLASPFAWVGPTASLYLEADPFWSDLAAKPENRERAEFLQTNLSRLPLGVNIAVVDPLRLAAFLTALRTMATQAAPGLVEWGTRKHQEIDYVVITPSARAGIGLAPDTHLFYLPAPEGLTLTFNEALMKRAIERLIASRAANAPKPAPWPGDHLALAADPAALTLAASLAGETGVRGWMQRRAWANLAILNEWKRLFPDQDPVALHERLWGVRLTSAAGGTYTWNETWLTMESSVFGHPGEPKPGPELPSGLADIARVSFGLGFEPLPAAPAAPPADAATPGPTEKVHVVQQGDTLKSVAQKSGVTEAWLIRRNELQTHVLAVGQKLIVRDPNAAPVAIPPRTEGPSYGLRVRITVEPKAPAK